MLNNLTPSVSPTVTGKIKIVIFHLSAYRSLQSLRLEKQSRLSNISFVAYQGVSIDTNMKNQNYVHCTVFHDTVTLPGHYQTNITYENLLKSLQSTITYVLFLDVLKHYVGLMMVWMLGRS